MAIAASMHWLNLAFYAYFFSLAIILIYPNCWQILAIKFFLGSFFIVVPSFLHRTWWYHFSAGILFFGIVCAGLTTLAWCFFAKFSWIPIAHYLAIVLFLAANQATCFVFCRYLRRRFLQIVFLILYQFLLWQFALAPVGLGLPFGSILWPILANMVDDHDPAYWALPWRLVPSLPTKESCVEQMHNFCRVVASAPGDTIFFAPESFFENDVFMDSQFLPRLTAACRHGQVCMFGYQPLACQSAKSLQAVCCFSRENSQVVFKQKLLPFYEDSWFARPNKIVSQDVWLGGLWWHFFLCSEFFTVKLWQRPCADIVVVFVNDSWFSSAMRQRLFLYAKFMAWWWKKPIVYISWSYLRLLNFSAIVDRMRESCPGKNVSSCVHEKRFRKSWYGWSNGESFSRLCSKFFDTKWLCCAD